MVHLKLIDILDESYHACCGPGLAYDFVICPLWIVDEGLQQLLLVFAQWLEWQMLQFLQRTSVAQKLL